MTTIAFDGRYLAADTLGVRSGNRSERPLCKLAVDGAIAYAIGGAWWAIREVLVAWHQCGHPIDDYPNPRGLDGCLVAVEADTRQCSVFTHEAPYPDLEAAPIGFGTGGDIALGAMGAGLTAMEAVALAARWDLKTGGPIDFVDLEFIDKGVQRWDGTMPSAKFPMPLRQPFAELAPVELHYVEFDETAGSFKVTGNGKTARRVPDLSEETLIEAMAELRREHPNGKIRARPTHAIVTVCAHGYIPSTCEVCRANRTANLYAV